MQVLKSTIPYVISFSIDEIYTLSNSCHGYKEKLKGNYEISKSERRKRLKRVNQMLTLFDLML